ncbi:MAG: hypothetical protein E7169_03750 [Firmicutes bacterium]|nr:hypothetical protein [Bacillota bacterium]
MKILKHILKFILLLILCVLLVLTQIFVILFALNLAHQLILNDKSYMLLTNNSMYKYIVVFVIISTFLCLIYFNKKGWVKLNDDLIYLGKFIYNRYFIFIFGFVSLIVFILTSFNFDVIYKDKIVSYSILNVSGKTYQYEDIKEVNVKIKKHFNGSLSANYILIFDNHQIEVLSSIINVKDEKDSYDHSLFIDEKIKTLNIKKDINAKYLDEYTSSLDKVYADKITKLFEKN